jgi:phage-related minor tail protein
MTTERIYTTDLDAYQIYVGGITPKEFVATYGGNVEQAISEFLEGDWPWDDEIPPSWLSDAPSAKSFRIKGA